MPNSKHYLAGAFSLVFGCLSGTLYVSSAQAQEDEEAVLEEIIVSASRRDEALQDVALAMSVLDLQKFADAGMTRLADILPFVPGVIILDGGTTGGGSEVIIRGVNAFGSGGIGTYIDDIPYGSATFYSSGGNPVDGTLLDLKSLNVLKGPQGTLFGANAMGGMLRYKTNQASLDHWTGDVSADLSSTDGGGLNQLYRVSANGPIVSDTIGVSFTAFWNDKTGFIDNVTIPKKNWDDNEYYGASGSIFWQATERLTFNLQGFYQNTTNDGLAQVQANGLDDFPVPGVSAGEAVYGRYKTGEDLGSPLEFETQLLGLTIEYEFDSMTLTSVTSTQELTNATSADLTVPFAGLADIFYPEDAPHTSATFFGSLGWDKVTQEFRLTSESNQKFEWLLGAFYQDEDGYNTQDLVIVPEANLLFANFPSGYEEKSLFANGTYYFTPDVDASFGVRYSDTTSSVELENRDSLLVPSLPFNKVTDNTTTYLSNIRWRRSENMSVYGRIASGYRPPAANFVLLNPDTGESLTEPFVKGDTLWEYTVGIKGTSSDGRFGYDFSAFYIDWTDYIISVVRFGLSVVGNADSASSKGFEGSLNFAATDSLTFNGTLSYINAQLEADEPDLGGASGDRLPGTPEWSGTVSFNWDFQMGSLPAYLAGSWRYSGKANQSFAGYTDSDGTDFPASAPYYVMPSYNDLGLRLGITTENFDVSLYGTNLANSDDWVAFSPSLDGFSLGTPMRPRTFGVVMRYKFN